MRRIRLLFLWFPLVFAVSSPLVADLADLKAREAAVMTAIERGRPATVAIVGVEGAGSGVIVDPSGLVISASHVVGDPGSELTICLADGRRVKAESLGSYRSVDAGMARITEPGPWPFVEPVETSDLELGTWCVALGHSGGYDSTRPAPVRVGRLLQKPSRENRWLRTDCTLVGGDSGGPLFDLEGNLIGIHSSIGISLTENRHVPADSFLDYWDEMANGEVRGWLGVPGDLDAPFIGVFLAPTEDEDGVMIEHVLDRSPAEVAGIRGGDRVIAVDDRPVESIEQLQHGIAQLAVGQTVELTVIRADSKVTKSVTIGRRGG